MLNAKSIKNTIGFAFFGGIIVLAVYQQKSPPTFEESHDLDIYTELHNCVKKDTAEGIDSVFTAMPGTPRYEYTCDNGKVFRRDK